MGCVERGRDLGDDAGDARRVQRAEPPEERPHVSPADIAHRDEQDSGGLTGLEDRDDVRMVNGRGSPRLADEPLAERVVPGDLGRQDLQRDPPAEPPVDDRHAAPADLLLQPVAGDLRASRGVAGRGRDFVSHRASSARPSARCRHRFSQRRQSATLTTRFTGKLRDRTPVSAPPAISCQPQPVTVTQCDRLHGWRLSRPVGRPR